ncbi:MAG: hypothetical protein ACPLPS_08310, partial [bacterium]
KFKEIPCFEPTYKELKFMPLPQTMSLGQRFEPTYKELKPFSRNNLFPPTLSFEPTYKEWKLIRCQMKCGVLAVLF